MQGLLTDSNKFCTVKVSLPCTKSPPTPTTFSPLSRVGGQAGVEVESRYVSRLQIPLLTHIGAPGRGWHAWLAGGQHKAGAGGKGGFGGSCC